jgi:copper transport protein
MTRRLGCVAVSVAALGLALPAAAGAHALLLRTEPADGSRLSSPPRVIRLWFNEALSPRFRDVNVVGADGRSVPGVRIRGGGARLELLVPRLPRGAYGVVWHVLSEDDGHTTSGTLVFGVGVGPVPGGHESPPAPPATDVLLRWLHFSFLALLVGGLAFAGLVLPFARPWLDPRLAVRAARRASRGAALAGAGALAVQLGMLAHQTDALAGGTSRSWRATLRELVFASRWGVLWLAGLGLLAVLTVLALDVREPRLSARAAAVAVPAALGLAAVDALGSHAAALPDRGGAVAADAAHILGAGLWLGALSALAFALVPIRGFRRVDAHAVARAVRGPFATLAGGSLLVVALTGLYSAGVQVASVDALLTTLYGRVLVVKAAIVLLCCGLGAANFLALRMLDRRRLARALRITIGVEAVAGACALLAAAVLTASAPARGLVFGQPRPVRAPTLAAQVRDVVLSVTVSPNRPGVNLVRVVAASSRRPAPAAISGVSVRGTPLRRVGGGWVGSVRLQAPGDASLAVLVRRAGASFAGRINWRVDPADPSRPVRFSSRRLASLVDPALVLVLGMLAAAGAVALFLRWNRYPPRFSREGHA